jgi:hypothetical protein
LYHRDIGTPWSLAQAQFDYPIALAASGKSLPSRGAEVGPFSGRVDLERDFRQALAETYAPR